MNIIVSAGGTGGHIYPAIEIIKEFEKNDKNLNILYIGTHNRMEKDIVPKMGYRYESLEIYGFTKDMKKNIKNVFLINKAYKKCLKIMKEFKPDVVIGVGGYVTYPVLKAAHKLKIKTAIHEQNSRPGKVNYLVSKYTDLCMISFESSKKHIKNTKKIIYTGHPSLNKALNSKKCDKSIYGLSKDKKLVLYVAGSLGSLSLNNKMIEFLNSKFDYEILYIAGNNVNIDEFKKKIHNKNVKIIPYVNDLPSLMKASDVVISRAGAGSLFEVIGTKSPSIIIPSPNVAGNHQYYNAKELADKQMIVMLEEKDVNEESLTKEINDLLENQEKVKTLKTNMEKYLKIDPRKIIYESIKKLIK